jgi:hypothetical protein
MRKKAKNPLISARFVFKQQTSPEKPEEGSQKTLDNISNTITKSLLKQGEFKEEVSDKLKPIGPEVAAFGKVISEMNKERLENIAQSGKQTKV